jgi:fatty acid desaturase
LHALHHLSPCIPSIAERLALHEVRCCSAAK